MLLKMFSLIATIKMHIFLGHRCTCGCSSV